MFHIEGVTPFWIFLHICILGHNMQSVSIVMPFILTLFFAGLVLARSSPGWTHVWVKCKAVIFVILHYSRGFRLKLRLAVEAAAAEFYVCVCTSLSLNFMHFISPSSFLGSRLNSQNLKFCKVFFVSNITLQSTAEKKMSRKRWQSFQFLG